MNIESIDQEAKVYERFLRKIKINEDGCWRWKGHLNPKGYGTFSFDNKSSFSHRYSYLVHKGPFGPGLVTDHLCRVRDCCNPEHLEAVTTKVNTNRGVVAECSRARLTKIMANIPLEQKRETIKIAQAKARQNRIDRKFCIHGHEFNEKNTYRRLNHRGVSERCCRECAKNYQQRLRDRKRGALEA